MRYPQLWTIASCRHLLPAALLGFLPFAATLACSPLTHTLVVELHSDLQPGVDFAYAEVELSEEAEAEAVRRQRFEPAALSAVDGVAIGQFDGLVEGGAILSVKLRDRNDGLVAARRVQLSIVGSVVVPILVGRACQGVRCPRSGDAPGSVDCIAGRCFDPACFANPGSCEPLECQQDTDCDPPLADCALARCVQGMCLAVVDLPACAEGEYCDLGFGCRPEPADLCPAEGCDDGIDCTDDTCVFGRCEFDPVHVRCNADPSGFCDGETGCQYVNTCPADGCDDGVPCTQDACVSGRCEFVPIHSACDAQPRGFCEQSAGCEYLDPCPAEGVCQAGETRSCTACVNGNQTCDRQCQWGTCAPPSSAVEILCNGVDDDCNRGTSDSACPPDSACSSGSCQPLPPRFDSVFPQSMASCSCIDFTITGAHFRPGIRGFISSSESPTPEEFSNLVYDGATQLRVPNACIGVSSVTAQVYFENPDHQRTVARGVPVSASFPVITSLTPVTVRWGQTFCPSFRLARSGGACQAARWAVGDCMGNTVPGVGGELMVDPLAPDVATATGDDCLPVNSATAAAGTYCLWVVNPDGSESSHTGIEVVVTEN